MSLSKLQWAKECLDLINGNYQKEDPLLKLAGKLIIMIEELQHYEKEYQELLLLDERLKTTCIEIKEQLLYYKARFEEIDVTDLPQSKVSQINRQTREINADLHTLEAVDASHQAYMQELPDVKQEQPQEKRTSVYENILVQEAAKAARRTMPAIEAPVNLCHPRNLKRLNDQAHMFGRVLEDYFLKYFKEEAIIKYLKAFLRYRPHIEEFVAEIVTRGIRENHTFPDQEKELPKGLGRLQFVLKGEKEFFSSILTFNVINAADDFTYTFAFVPQKTLMALLMQPFEDKKNYANRVVSYLRTLCDKGIIMVRTSNFWLLPLIVEIENMKTMLFGSPELEDPMLIKPKKLKGLSRKEKREEAWSAVEEGEE